MQNYPSKLLVLANPYLWENYSQQSEHYILLKIVILIYQKFNIQIYINKRARVFKKICNP